MEVLSNSCMYIGIVANRSVTGITAFDNQGNFYTNLVASAGTTLSMAILNFDGVTYSNHYQVTIRQNLATDMIALPVEVRAATIPSADQYVTQQGTTAIGGIVTSNLFSNGTGITNQLGLIFVGTTASNSYVTLDSIAPNTLIQNTPIGGLDSLYIAASSSYVNIPMSSNVTQQTVLSQIINNGTNIVPRPFSATVTINPYYNDVVGITAANASLVIYYLSPNCTNPLLRRSYSSSSSSFFPSFSSSSSYPIIKPTAKK